MNLDPTTAYEIGHVLRHALEDPEEWQLDKNYRPRGKQERMRQGVVAVFMALGQTLYDQAVCYDEAFPALMAGYCEPIHAHEAGYHGVTDESWNATLDDIDDLPELPH